MNIYIHIYTYIYIHTYTCPRRQSSKHSNVNLIQTIIVIRVDSIGFQSAHRNEDQLVHVNGARLVFAVAISGEPELGHWVYIHFDVDTLGSRGVAEIIHCLVAHDVPAHLMKFLHS